MNEFRADLHCHTSCSDGTLTPTEIVHLAKKIGLSGLSITDHDTVEAYQTAVPVSKEVGIDLLTGVEFSTMFNGVSIHLLGYGFDVNHPELLEFCRKHRLRREGRNRDILKLLTKHGMPLTEADLEEMVANHLIQNSKNSVGRPHIALAMIKKGYVKSVKEAFQKYIGDGLPCYANGPSFTSEETIEVIHRAKGIAVIAHPHLIQNYQILTPLMELNFDGIECYYGKFYPKDHERWLKIAMKRDWLVTGGSDFHGDIKPDLPLGSSWVDQERFQAIKYKCESIRKAN